MPLLLFDNFLVHILRQALGSAGYYLVSSVMLVFDFGAVLSYFIIMADAAQLAAQQLFAWCTCNPMSNAPKCTKAKCTKAKCTNAQMPNAQMPNAQMQNAFVSVTPNALAML